VLPKNQAGYAVNTIVCGHQRKRALELNGVTETEVLVRHDLAEAKKDLIEFDFLEDNRNRHHHHKLDEARVVYRQFQLEKKLSRGSYLDRDEADARDRVGKAIGMSGRNLQRYFSVLKTPAAVQEAFRGKQLRLEDAAKVATLQPDTQNEIAERIRRGESPKSVVLEFLGRRQKRKPLVCSDGVVAIFNRLTKALNHIEGIWQQLPPEHLQEHLAALDRGAAVLTAMVSKVRDESTDGDP
jgi:hypothetical protein